MIFILSWHTVADIAGGSIGGLLIIIIIIAIVVLVIFLCWRKRKQNCEDITLQPIIPHEVTSSATYAFQLIIISCFYNYIALKFWIT